MDTTEILRNLFSFSIYKVPILLVIVAGIVYSGINYSKYRTVNKQVFGGLAILLIVEILSIFLPLVNIYLFRDGMSNTSYIYATSLLGFLLSLGFAAGLGLILLAVWTNRRPE